MTIQTALLPHKHVRFADSILALAGFVKTLLTQPQSLDELWSHLNTGGSPWLGNVSFTHLVLALDLLYAIHQIESAAENRVQAVAA